MKIYYFSGTGNSLFISQQLLESFSEAELIPIASLLGKKTINIDSDSAGIVFPVHALTIPIAVKQFLKKCDFSECRYFFAIANREGTLFRGFEKIDHILKAKKRTLDAAFLIEMPNNDPRRENYKPSSPEKIERLEKKAHEQISFIIETIKSERIHRIPDKADVIGFPYFPLMNKFLEKAVLGGMEIAPLTGGVNYFSADEKCSGCGICEKVCLSEKIKMKDKRPVWSKKQLCYMCYACVNFCPAQAIQVEDIPFVKSFTRQNGRYSHPYAKVKDMEAQKKSLHIEEK